MFFVIKKLSLLLVILVFVIHQPLHEPVRAADLKIEIVQIKDSGSSPFWSPDGKEIVYVVISPIKPTLKAAN